MEITRQRLSSRPINYVNVIIGVEDGCKPEEDEYSIHITSFLGSLNIEDNGGCDDITLIKECVTDANLDFPKNGELHIVLKEAGEWEDVFWHKYYIIDRVCKIEY